MTATDGPLQYFFPRNDDKKLSSAPCNPSVYFVINVSTSVLAYILRLALGQGF